MTAQSILQKEKKCYITGRTDNLHLHHIYFGHGLRKISDREGFVVYLTGELHNQSNQGVHFNRQFDLHLKRCCQKVYEAQGHTREEFIALIGRSYL